MKLKLIYKFNMLIHQQFHFSLQNLKVQKFQVKLQHFLLKIMYPNLLF